MADQLNIEDYMGIKEAMAKAEESNRPFMVPTEGEEIVVAGDVNETSLNARTFKVSFRVPKPNEDGTLSVSYKTVEYRDVFIKPRDDLRIIKTVGELVPFFEKYAAGGQVEEFSNEEIAEIVLAMSDEIIDRIYNVVAAVCGINDVLKPYIEFGSALTVLLEIFRSIPGNSQRG